MGVELDSLAEVANATKLSLCTWRTAHVAKSFVQCFNAPRQKTYPFSEPEVIFQLRKRKSMCLNRHSTSGCHLGLLEMALLDSIEEQKVSFVHAFPQEMVPLVPRSTPV